MRRLLLPAGMILLWLVVANATCNSGRPREDLIKAYELARYELVECEEMGAGHLEAVSLEGSMRLKEEIVEDLAAGKWSRVEKEIAELQERLAILLERMKSWDADEDGLSNYAEFILYGTDWSSKDSDGDGYLDGSEILRYQTDPLDHCGVPPNMNAEAPVLQRCPALEKLRRGG